MSQILRVRGTGTTKDTKTTNGHKFTRMSIRVLSCLPGFRAKIHGSSVWGKASLVTIDTNQDPYLPLWLPRSSVTRPGRWSSQGGVPTLERGNKKTTARLVSLSKARADCFMGRVCKRKLQIAQIGANRSARIRVIR